ncbi:hypothetical protein AAGW05_00035 [Arthrobacter sp. LAPM80]|uniref:hypothetical protein n=1 Tax=Arthrobacter sp. LAPM80 TaxID=3141788 RepID=UPI00398A594B
MDALPCGGTCALRGCDPKKILRRGAEIIDAANLTRNKGISGDRLSIDWPALMRHKRGFTDGVLRPIYLQQAFSPTPPTRLDSRNSRMVIGLDVE